MPAAHTLFSPEWMNAWKEAINNSADYKKHGSTWNEPLLLLFEDHQSDSASDSVSGFYLNLSRGSCLELRYANQSDAKAAPTVLSAPQALWKDLLENSKDPLYMLMKGSIKLKKGSMMKLSMQRKAAKALLGAASAKLQPAGEADILYVHDHEEPAEYRINPKPAEERKNGTKFSSTSRGIDFDSYPMQLFQKAKKLGVWDPAAIDLTTDRQQWLAFSEQEQTVLLHLSSQFMAGEEAVTLDLLPLIQTVASEGRIEEEMFLTSFLWEEAKHTEFFALFLRDVAQSAGELHRFHGPAYTRLFNGELGTALQRLQHDRSPEAQLIASVTYNMIVEGTLAETGYEAYYRMLTENDMLPGLREGIGLLKRDESRHIAFGLYFIGRLLDEHPGLKPLLESEASRLLPMAVDVVDEMFEPYDTMPFGLEKSWFIDYAMNQFSKRMEKLTGSHA